VVTGPSSGTLPCFTGYREQPVDLLSQFEQFAMLSHAVIWGGG